MLAPSNGPCCIFKFRWSEGDEQTVTIPEHTKKELGTFGESIELDLVLLEETEELSTVKLEVVTYHGAQLNKKTAIEAIKSKCEKEEIPLNNKMT